MNNISIVIGGEAGQGIKTIEYVLTRIFKFSGMHVFSTKEYESRIRGGVNSTEIIVSSQPVNTFVDKIDLLLVLNNGVVDHLATRIDEDTLVLGEKENISDSEREKLSKYHAIPIEDLAKEAGKKIYSNSVVVGVICGLFGLKEEVVTNTLENYFSKKGSDIVDNNINAMQIGKVAGVKLKDKNQLDFRIKTNQEITDHLLLNGNDAVALGAMNGGCNFMSFYPMSPGTGVATFFAQHSNEMELVVEQAEDEIAAINMAIGAWYAGARAMITTSGGGYALMNEGLSLSGVTETPVVFHIGQRPGPGTGLPTRMGQEDLMFALFGGHGEFPRIILAPGDLKDGYMLGKKAFELADKYQVPVFILTDQYYLDSNYNIDDLPFSDQQNKNYFIETKEGYQRYKLTDDGISPRGIPGHGKGLVTVDSDEHDQEGRITENFDVRINMVDKRLKKADKIKEDYIDPEFFGNDDYDLLLLSWGSSKNAVLAAMAELDGNNIGYLHIKQLSPFHEKIGNYLSKASRNVCIENNATGQLAKLIKMETDQIVHSKILKYNGLPFSREELVEKIKTEIEEV
jgi:2-oxoglutarate ferredoxin oxidoreductase subunit alpha